MSDTTLSPEAKRLVENTLEWLQPKGRWIKNFYGVVKGKDGYVAELEERDMMEERGWMGWEEEVYHGDSYWDDEYEVVHPYDHKSEVDQACLVGAMLAANDYHDDEAFREAKEFLAQLVLESKEKADALELHGALRNDPESVLTNFNDKSPDRTRVMNLLRRAVSRA